MTDRGRQLLLRVVFVAVLAGGLLYWSQLRKPQDLKLQIDLTSALPGEITELELVVRREGHLITRKQIQYGKAGAPGLFETEIHARPGPTDVEVTLVYENKSAHRTSTTVDLAGDKPARISAR
jgi:hypothetical protein